MTLAPKYRHEFKYEITLREYFALRQLVDEYISGGFLQTEKPGLSPVRVFLYFYFFITRSIRSKASFRVSIPQVHAIRT